MGYAALAAFDVGGIIPGSGAVPIFGHGGERVLTGEQTKTFDQFVANMGGSSSTSNSASVNTINHFNGMSDRHFQAMMTRNAEHAVKTVHRGLRKQGRI